MLPEPAVLVNVATSWKGGIVAVCNCWGFRARTIIARALLRSGCAVRVSITPVTGSFGSGGTATDGTARYGARIMTAWFCARAAHTKSKAANGSRSRDTNTSTANAKILSTGAFS